MKVTHRLGLVLQEPHRVFDHHFVLESNKLDDLFGDPRAHDLQIDLAHVDFAVKLGRELHRLEEPVLLVGKAPVLHTISTQPRTLRWTDLLGRRALEETCVGHGCSRETSRFQAERDGHV